MLRIILTLFLSCFCTISVFARQESRVNFLSDLETPTLKNAQVSFYAKYVGGKEILSRNENTLFVPASVLKLYTTASALEVLGPDKTFETRLYFDGKRRGITLHGDLYLLGSGDPSFGSRDFDYKPYYTEIFSAWAEILKKQGIKKINGNIYTDNTIFSGILLPWRTSYKNIGNYYAPKADALSIAGNQYTLVFPATKNGDKNIMPLTTDPVLNSIIFRSGVSASEKTLKEQVYVTFEPGINIVNLTGTLPVTEKQTKVYASLPNPAHFAADSLLESLRSAGIKVTGTARIKRGENYNDKQLFFTHLSPTLAELVKHTNKRSDNLYAEVLLRDISAYTEGNGSAQDGLIKMKQALISLGLDENDFDIYGASGLDYTSNVSCRATVTLLENILNKPYAQIFKDSLVVAGGEEEKSIFGKRVAKKEFAIKTLLKTGALDKARAVAGYTKDKDGKDIAFCLFVNNFTATSRQITALQDNFLNYLAAYKYTHQYTQNSKSKPRASKGK